MTVRSGALHIMLQANLHFIIDLQIWVSLSKHSKRAREL
jgi:hypothetical protein